MNARIYNPALHRFLEADNYLQDPYNTQNYNRYGYCVNNPLKYTDITGNVFNIATVAGCIPIVGSIISSLLMHQTVDFGRVFVDIVITGISIGVTFGIGSACASITNFYSRMAVSALAHGVFQGGMTAAQGGKFWAGFAAGAVSSIASSFWQGGSTYEEGFLQENNWAYGVRETVHTGIGAGTGAIGTIVFGSIMGGAGSLIGGGNFWQGAVTGLIVSSFNHVAHDEDPPRKKAPNLDQANKFYKKNKSINTIYEVDASSVDLNFLDVSGWKLNSKHVVQTLYSSTNGVVFGKLELTYLGENQVKISNDIYDFNLEFSNPIKFTDLISPRNLFTAIGQINAGVGTSFTFRFNGVNTIKPKIPVISDLRYGLF